jgi:hypothetical protein
MAIWYSLWSLVIHIFPNLVCFDQEKSGNPDLSLALTGRVTVRRTSRLCTHSSFMAPGALLMAVVAEAQLDYGQGDQIGRIFAFWANFRLLGDHFLWAVSQKIS